MERVHGWEYEPLKNSERPEEKAIPKKPNNPQPTSAKCKPKLHAHT